MRIYLNGGMMVMDERMPILHHHAPRGGLRTHNMRVVTRLARRRSVYKRNLTSPTDAYIALRYYGQDHLQEETLLTALTNLRTQGSLIKQMVGFLIGLVLLPDSLGKIRASVQEAHSLLEKYPQIPGLDDQTKTRGDSGG
ncbi:MAG: hypothetical protein IPK19_19865 [Chloroflexi bacterium]|nr:hypothetical protein [Chloroflexota bacterium]